MEDHKERMAHMEQYVKANGGKFDPSMCVCFLLYPTAFFVRFMILK